MNVTVQLEFGGKGTITDLELSSFMKERQSVLERVQAEEAKYRDNLGWFHVDKWAGEAALSKIERFAGRVRADGEVLVVIGVGGSNQAARAVVKALPKRTGLEIVYAGNNVSSSYIYRLLEGLEGKSVYIDVIAKNFETLEPGIGFRILRKYLKKRYGKGYEERIFVTGTRGQGLYLLCKKHDYAFLDFPEDIGGRYSGLCDVSLFPAAVAGIDVRAMVKGARDMERELKRETGEKNPAFRYAAIRSLLYQKGFRIEMLASFEPELGYLHSWWTQLFAESEGKEGKGLFPTAVKYPEDLHSMGQFVQEGTPVLFETFLEFKDGREGVLLEADEVGDGFDYLNGMDLREVAHAITEAVLKAHGRRIPWIRLKGGELDEYGLGQLFYFFEFACYLSGSMLGVNPFDQPGVEGYKEIMFKALGK